MMTKKKGQQWFDEKYSKEINIDITGSRRLNFTGFLKIEGCKNLESISLKKLKITDLRISNCSQLNIINLTELNKLTSLLVTDCPKLTTLNCSPNGLTSLEISGCPRLNNITNLSKASKLASLSMIYCPSITKLDCSSSEKLTELEVSDLTELKCSNTSIKSLSVNLSPNIKKLDCSNNDKLISLNISNCKELEFLDCSNSKLISLDINNCESLVKEYKQNGNKSKNFKYPPDLKIIQKRINKNIVIVGRTGGGKSTLSNVLTGTDDFEESGRSISVTKNFQKEGFEWNGKNFNVVDTIGVGDTKLSTKKVLYKVLDGIFSLPEGISQILFVIDGRFTSEEAKIFNLLKGSIFENFENDIRDILNYVTIVRTKFSNFKNKNVCEEDKKQLHNENEIIAKIVKSCRDVVYVDNPPVNIQINDEDDKETVKTNKKIRERSRKIILDYLDNACQEKYFKLKTWDQIRKSITEYLESNCDDVPPELEKNEEVQILIKITESFCSIT